MSASLLLSVLLAAVSADAARPNIVLIVADDLGWNDVGYHNAEMLTPNIDRLVKAGIELDSHYVQPECTPTRVALLTGRYPSRFGRHCTQASNARALPEGTPTLASLLRAAGYDTALIGKWHLGSKPEWGPNRFGFDYSYGCLAGATGVFDHRYRLTRPEFSRTWHRNGAYVDEPGHVTDLEEREAVAFIEKPRSGPFFLYLPFQAAHVPLVEDDSWLRTNAHFARFSRRLFAAAVSHLDNAIGRVLDALDKSNQRADTLILFTSDNGAQRHHAGNAYPAPDPKLTDFSSNEPLRGRKTETYEGGIRVPAFVHWPGQLQPGRQTAPLHAVDWLPTILGLVGLPLDEKWALDGRDQWGVLSGQVPASDGRVLYWVWGPQRAHAALRRGSWKIVRSGVGAPWQLFDLADDPREATDLASQQPDRVAELAALFAREEAKDAL